MIMLGLEHHACKVNLLAMVEFLKEAYTSIIKEMPFKLTSIYGAQYLMDVGFEVIWNWVFSFCLINLSELRGLRRAQWPLGGLH